MGALEIRQELHKFIDIGDTKFLAVLYKTANEYIERQKRDRMIQEAEEDIKAGNTYSLKEAKQIIDNWKVK